MFYSCGVSAVGWKRGIIERPPVGGRWERRLILSDARKPLLTSTLQPPSLHHNPLLLLSLKDEVDIVSLIGARPSWPSYDHYVHLVETEYVR